MINLSGNAISTVWREDGYIFKKQIKYLCENEFWCLEQLKWSGYTPLTCQRIDDETIKMEDLGHSQPVTDQELFLSYYEKVLFCLWSCGIRHGDLTEYSIIVKDNKPYIIDFAESRLLADPRPDKRPEGDAWWLKKSMNLLAGI